MHEIDEKLTNNFFEESELKNVLWKGKGGKLIL